MADQNEIDKVLEATDIVGLVSEYVKLEKFGKNYKGLCPFHSEATPSFVVSTDKKIAHCFGCGGGGNAIKFLSQIENISFNDALAKLASKAGISISLQQSVKKDQGFTKLYEIMQNSMEFYKNNLLKTQLGLKALDYLNKRGLDEETIKVFNIGLAPNSYDSLYKVLTDLNYKELDMIDLGLVSRNDSNEYYDLFKNRIMFPIKNDNGNVIGFSGRIYDTTDKNQAKYINTKETLIFKKGQNLFNLDLAKSEALKKKRIILHEGQMDVIASYRSGLKEAICTLGTALTEEQAKLIKKYSNNIIVCYDGDKAGINASIKAIRLLRRLGFIIHLVKLPNGMDPDEYVLKLGKDEYVKYFESNIIDATAYIFNQAIEGKNLNDSTQAEEAKRIIFDELCMTSASTKEAYLNKLASILNVSIQGILQDYNTYFNLNTQNEPNNYFEEPNYPVLDISTKPELRNIICEFKLITVAKRSREEALQLDDRINNYLSCLSDQGREIWIKLIDTFYQNYSKFSETYFIKLLSEENLKYYTTGLEQLTKYCHGRYNYTKEDIDACVRKLRITQINEQNKSINKKISQSNDLDEQIKLIEQKFANKKVKQKLKMGGNKNAV